MKTILLFAISLSFALGQERLTPEESVQAWAQVERSKTNGRTTIGIRPIPLAVLVREQQVGGIGDRVWLTFSLPGTYLMNGVNCEGVPYRLGEFGIGSQNVVIQTLVVDTTKLIEAAPYQARICSVSVFRLYSGQVEELRVELAEHPKPMVPRILGEGINGRGEYFVHISSEAPISATMGVGRNAISLQKEFTPNGSIFVNFPRSSHIPDVGLSTLTICRDSICESQVFERQIQVPTPKG